MELEVIPQEYLSDFKSSQILNALNAIDKSNSSSLSHYQYHAAIAAVNSMACENSEVSLLDFVNWLQLNQEKPPAELVDVYNLYRCYLFIEDKKINRENTNELHKILAEPHLPKVYHGEPRLNPLFVVDAFKKIEYTACDVKKIEDELGKYFRDIEKLYTFDLNNVEHVYLAISLHLVFHKIQPYHNFNMPIARLLEKWYLITVYGAEAISIPTEKIWFENEVSYVANRRKIGKDYYNLNYSRSSQFYTMAAQAYK